MSSPVPFFIVGFFALLANMSPAQSVDQPIVDPDREVVLALPWKQFDQTPNSGWRIYVNQDRSEYLIAADLIEAYLKRRKDLSIAERAYCQYHGSMMYVYRAARRNEDPRFAIPKITQAMVDGKPDGLPADWNHLVRATVAFLVGDRDSLLALKLEVAALPSGAANWPNYPNELLENLGMPYGSWVPGFVKRAVVIQQVRTELATLLKKEEVKLPVDKPVTELGADELTVIEWVMALEREFRIRINDDTDAKSKRADLTISAMASVVVAALESQIRELKRTK
jgi:acyl carrier protein